MSLLESFDSWVSTASGIVWGAPMLILILGVGLYLMIGLKAYPLTHIPKAFSLLMRGRSSQQKGDISPFNALMTSLSATIGTGNIAGVATALFFGGPGALFWMWCTALVGMATKYAEAVCAVHYREQDEQGNYSGGPMYYIKNGLGDNWRWLAACFAAFGALAGFGIGDGVQANSVASALSHSFDIDPKYTSAVLVLLVGMVILGGVKRISHVAGVLVPFMACAYLLAGLSIIFIYIDQLPAVLKLIVSSAFSGEAAAGGATGSAIMLAIRWGVARGIFSNEAGLGSAPIAHAAAQTDSPVRQGTIAMLGTFIDTIIVCSVTGLAILLTGAMSAHPELNGPQLSGAAFAMALPYGDYIISIGLAVFAFTTILGWSYYGERCAVYLLGARVILPYRLLWLAMIPVGAMSDLKLIWNVADVLNALMAIPNLVALLLLSPVIFKLTKEAIESSQDR